MRVVSLVPSWTETLITAGIEVVGRTRYCIYPENTVAGIPVVGGTKDANWDLIRELKPDILILDQEENPIDLAMESPVPVFVTHVVSIESLQSELTRLGEYFENAILIEMSLACLDVLEAPRKSWSPQNIPGLIESVGLQGGSHNQIMYVIWKKPWMSIGPKTYIGSVLKKLGANLFVPPFDEKYPIVELEEAPDAYLLFSTEPYPFHKKVRELEALKRSGAVVNGELYSWFGVRSLKFLYEMVLGKALELESIAAVDGKSRDKKDREVGKVFPS